MGYQAGVIDSMFSDMMQRIIAGDGMNHGDESREDAEDEGSVYEDGSTPEISWQNMLHHRERVEDFVGSRNDHFVLGYVHML